MKTEHAMAAPKVDVVGKRDALNAPAAVPDKFTENALSTNFSN